MQHPAVASSHEMKLLTGFAAMTTGVKKARARTENFMVNMIVNADVSRFYGGREKEKYLCQTKRRRVILEKDVEALTVA